MQLTSLRQFLILQYVDIYGNNQYDTNDNLLVVRLKAYQRKANLEHRHKAYADDSSRYGSGTAAHGGSSDDSAADGVQLDSAASAGRHGLVRGAVGQRRQTCAETGDNVSQHLIIRYVDSGKPCGLFVASNRDYVTSRPRLIQKDA